MMSYYSEYTGGFDPNDESFADNLNKSRGSGFSEEKSDFIQIKNGKIEEEDESEGDTSSKHSISQSRKSERETNVAVELEANPTDEPCLDLEHEEPSDEMLRHF